MSPATCPSREKLHEFLVGTLPPDDADTIDAHLESCTTCQQNLQALDDGQDSFVSLLRQPAVDEYAEEPARGRLVSAAKGLLVAAAAGGDRSTTLVPNDPTMVAAEIGEYELLEKLGEGGMGAVYKARQKKLKRIVAIRLLPKERPADPKAVARFEREMEAVGAVDHPNIVRAMYAGEHEGQPYLAIEYVDGLSLTEVVNCLKALRIADACELVRQAAVGLQHAHEKRLVHRDIKPSNLMLTHDGMVKVLDLGLALLHTPASRGPEMTAAGSMMGTADYVAPEQVTDSHSVDIRADIYSLGCTLYKLLSGRAPFVGPEYKNDITKIMAHVQKTPPPITLLRSDVPSDLAAVIERMMAKDPALRYSTPAEVAAALAPFAAGADLRRLMTEAMQIIEPGTAAAVPSSVTEQASGSPVTDTATSHPKVTQPGTSATPSPQPQPASDRRWPPRTIAIGLAAVAASVLLIALGVIVIRIRDKSGRETVMTVPDDAEVAVERDGKPVFDSGKKAAEKGTETRGRPADRAALADRPVGQEPRKLLIDPEPTPIEPAQAMSPTALVTRPASIAGVRSWTIETCQVRGEVTTVAYSPNSKWLASGGWDRLIRIWDVSSGKVSKVPVGTSSRITCLSWSPSGNELATSERGGLVRIWDARSGTLLRSIDSSSQNLKCVAWSPDGTTIAFEGKNGTITLWDVTTRRTVRSLPGNKDGVYAVSWHPRDRILASGCRDNTIQLWDVKMGDLVNVLEGHTRQVEAVAWSPDGKTLASGSCDGEFRLWEVNSGQGVLASGGGEVRTSNSVSWSPDGRSLLLSMVGAARVWDGVLRKHTVSSPWMHEVLAVAYAPDGNTVACGGRQGAILLCDAKTGETLHGVSRRNRQLESVDWSRDGQALAVGAEPGFSVWNCETAELRYSVQGPQGYPASVAWSPTDKRLACCGNGFLQIRDGETGELIRSLKCTWPRSSDWRPDGRSLAAGDAKVVTVYDAETGEPTQQFEHGGDAGYAANVSWSADGSMLAAGTYMPNTTIVFDGSTGQRKRAFPGANQDTPMWSPTGSLLATGSRPFVVWDSKTDSVVWQFHFGHERNAWSPDGTILATDGAYGVNLCLWSVSEKKQIAERVRHMDAIRDISFSPDGRLLATASRDGSVGLWNTTTWQPHSAVIMLPKSQVVIMADGHYRGSSDAEKDIVMVALTEDGQQLTMPPDEFAKRFCWKNDPSKVKLTPAE